MSKDYFSTYKSPNIVLTMPFCDGPPAKKFKCNQDTSRAPVEYNEANRAVASLREHATVSSDAISANIENANIVQVNDKPIEALQTIGESQDTVLNQSISLNQEPSVSYKSSFETSTQAVPNLLACDKTCMDTESQNQNSINMYKNPLKNFVIPKITHNQESAPHKLSKYSDISNDISTNNSNNLKENNTDLNQDSIKSKKYIKGSNYIKGSKKNSDSKPTKRLNKSNTEETTLRNPKCYKKNKLSKSIKKESAELKCKKGLTVKKIHDKTRKKESLVPESSMSDNDSSQTLKQSIPNLLQHNESYVNTECNNLKIYKNPENKFVIPKRKNNLDISCSDKNNGKSINDGDNDKNKIDLDQNFTKTTSSLVKNDKGMNKSICYSKSNYTKDFIKESESVTINLKHKTKRHTSLQNHADKKIHTNFNKVQKEISELKNKKKLASKNVHDAIRKNSKKKELKSLKHKPKSNAGKTKSEIKIKNKDEFKASSERQMKIKSISDKISSKIVKSDCKDKDRKQSIKHENIELQKSKRQKSEVVDTHESEQNKPHKSVINTTNQRLLKRPPSKHNINLRTKYDNKSELFKHYREEIYKRRKKKLSMNTNENASLTADNILVKKSDNIKDSVEIEACKKDSNSDECENIKVIINVFYKSSSEDTEKESDNVEKKSQPVTDDICSSFLDDFNIDEIVESLNSFEKEKKDSIGMVLPHTVESITITNNGLIINKECTETTSKIEENNSNIKENACALEVEDIIKILSEGSPTEETETLSDDTNKNKLSTNNDTKCQKQSSTCNNTIHKSVVEDKHARIKNDALNNTDTSLKNETVIIDLADENTIPKSVIEDKHACIKNDALNITDTSLKNETVSIDLADENTIPKSVIEDKHACIKNDISNNTDMPLKNETIIIDLVDENSQDGNIPQRLNETQHKHNEQFDKKKSATEVNGDIVMEIIDLTTDKKWVSDTSHIELNENGINRKPGNLRNPENEAMLTKTCTNCEQTQNNMNSIHLITKLNDNKANIDKLPVKHSKNKALNTSDVPYVDIISKRETIVIDLVNENSQNSNLLQDSNNTQLNNNNQVEIIACEENKESSRKEVADPNIGGICKSLSIIKPRESKFDCNSDSNNLLNIQDSKKNIMARKTCTNCGRIKNNVSSNDKITNLNDVGKKTIINKNPVVHIRNDTLKKETFTALRDENSEVGNMPTKSNNTQHRYNEQINKTETTVEMKKDTPVMVIDLVTDENWESNTTSKIKDEENKCDSNLESNKSLNVQDQEKDLSSEQTHTNREQIQSCINANNTNTNLINNRVIVTEETLQNNLISKNDNNQSAAVTAKTEIEKVVESVNIPNTSQNDLNVEMVNINNDTNASSNANLNSRTKDAVTDEFIKTLMGKIEYGMMKHLGLSSTITALIKNGKNSRIFHCKDTFGTDFVIKSINKMYSGSLITDRLRMIQDNVLKQNLNIVYFINEFTLDCGRHCFLMEYYPKTLKEALEENKKPFHINVVQILSRQLTSALLMLRHNSIVHLDINPNHILLNHTNNKLKLCGFDNSYFKDHIIYRPNISCPKYRAPEIILGYQIGYPVDIWATGLVMHEMATNNSLFRNGNNHQLLYKQMCILGNIPSEMIARSLFKDEHFSGNRFAQTDVFGQVRYITVFNRTNALKSSIYKAYFTVWGDSNSEQKQKDLILLNDFCKLLEEMLVMHPSNRMPIEYVYANPFIYE
ncbi:MATH and LRR domain-containing protein PFE0570w-like [Galleria mellonella]|uniref:MATH and LRR domain-containing protein PFE0570w-like n=1 Tax=Galleria mellonella TaxID=7137 RepID=A0A6J3CAM4_GALME|nr:MATH and LRR domain-containing protein PFE0570w-like [Galleria mellonella]XP_052756720.1 MATH and LRR domain-containing protein PFE0570w-like [Galleria mellonella]XP_052756721.1 MATH and LRR domain-containing protein PFE0570w-like [Galleria mellonella]XP_052756722.1 MATH and LRR domain-containing protein PFE0570w-like [Galleria mellonella]